MRSKNKVFQNAKWIIGCKIIQSLLQFAIGMITARYLGPANYGLIDYAASIVAFATPVMQLGLQNTLVQEYVTNPDKEGEILGTQLTMNAMAALACMVGVVSFAAVANPGEKMTLLVCALYSVCLLSQALEMMKYWFQAKLLSKYASLAILYGYLILAVYKVYLLMVGKSVYWFALSHAVEYGMAGLLMLIAYKKHGKQRIMFSATLAKEMLSKSKHYILAMLMVVVYNRIANIFLVHIYSEVENGYYAAALTCMSIIGFVFDAITDTARPVILESKKQSQEAFEKNTIRLYSLTTWLSIAKGVVFSVFASLIVQILYGQSFLPAVPVLQILAWQGVFSYMTVVRSIWILGEEKHSVLWIINLCGAVVSILLNAVLIPLWGACGAAVASVLVQIFTNVVMGFILKPIRRNNYLLIKGLNPKYILELIPLLKK